MPRTIGEAPKTERVAIPAGSYVLTLKEIKDYESEDIYAEPDELGERPKKKQLIWIFEADKQAPDKRPYEYAQFTGLFYGDERANMTHLLDGMLPDVDHATKRKGVDVEALVGRQYRVRIQYAPNQKGVMRPKITMMDPIGDGGLPGQIPAGLKDVESQDAPF